MTNKPILNRSIEAAAIVFTNHSPEEIGANPVVWLGKEAQDGMALLAHADDGVIWGKVMGEKIVFPDIDNFSQAELRPITLQMARLFNEETEIFLWRTGEGVWQARRVTDLEAGSQARDKRFPWAFDEQQVLWGMGIIGFDGEFSLAADGEEGLHHAPPVRQPEGLFDERSERLRGERKLRLTVRQYLTEDEQTGWLRIGMSRLVSVGMEEGS